MHKITYMRGLHMWYNQKYNDNFIKGLIIIKFSGIDKTSYFINNHDYDNFLEYIRDVIKYHEK